LKRRALTALDRHLIRTVYDPRLAPNLAAQPASQLACRILGERLAVSGADIEAVCSARKRACCMKARRVPSSQHPC
jgi:hypothetical protein